MDQSDIKAFAQQKKSSTKWKTIYRMGKIIYKECDWQGANIQNTQASNTT